MYSRKVYFDEDRQKVRWTSSTTFENNSNFEYVGKMNRQEFDLFIEILWELYEDNSIPCADFIQKFNELRQFCDYIKCIIDD